MNHHLSEDEIQRYSRHLLLAEIGEAGQLKLCAARVLLIGMGGLGSPLLLYLAAAGVGTIGIVDDDIVELSNLQRQVTHRSDRIGWAKVDSAVATAQAINPHVTIEPHAMRIGSHNAMSLIERYDLVCDGSDNFRTRFLVADACFQAHRPLVSAAVRGFAGQLSTFKPYLGPDAPCYRCLHPETQDDNDSTANCADAGILGAVAGVMGTLQATEVLKELLGIGESLSGRLLIWDALATQFRTVRLPCDPDCAMCHSATRFRESSARG
jgi:adenylyltransferase/sulfurtransferase